ncbi:MAG: hypothetical protein FD167_636, partial [bacterium]
MKEFKFPAYFLTFLLLVCSSIIYISSQANSKSLNLSNSSLPLPQAFVANQNLNESNLLLGTLLKGNTFNTRKFDLPQARTPISIKSGDLDGDSNLDLITANSDSNSLTILSNDGKG